MKKYSFKFLYSYALMSMLVIAILTAGHAHASETEAATAYSPEDCIECHRTGSEESGLQISIDEFNASIHAEEETTCQDCHTLVEDDNHQTTPGTGAVDCSSCHEQENRHGLGSNRGTRPHCYSCHTRHGTLSKDDPRSSVHWQRLGETCQSCHTQECGETNYLSWLPSLQIASHSKQDFSQAYSIANCLGCHQGKAFHGEHEPGNDQTCFTCHVTADGQNKLLGFMHSRADVRRQPGVMAAAVFYQVCLGILMIGGFVFFIRKLSKKF